MVRAHQSVIQRLMLIKAQSNGRKPGGWGRRGLQRHGACPSAVPAGRFGQGESRERALIGLRGPGSADAITSRLASGVACRVCRPHVQAGTVMHSVVRSLGFSAVALLLPKTRQCAVISVHSRRSGPGLGSRAAPCWRWALRQSAGSLRRRGAVTKQCPCRLCALSQRSHCPPGAPTSPVGGESIKLILAVWLHDMLAI